MDKTCVFFIEMIFANVVSHPLSSPYIHLRNVFLLEERVKGGRHLFAQGGYIVEDGACNNYVACPFRTNS